MVLTCFRPLLGPAVAGITAVVACPGVVAAADERCHGSAQAGQPLLLSEDKAGENGKGSLSGAESL